MTVTGLPPRSAQFKIFRAPMSTEISIRGTSNSAVKINSAKDSTVTLGRDDCLVVVAEDDR